MFHDTSFALLVQSYHAGTDVVRCLHGQVMSLLMSPTCLMTYLHHISTSTADMSAARGIANMTQCWQFQLSQLTQTRHNVSNVSPKNDLQTNLCWYQFLHICDSPVWQAGHCSQSHLLHHTTYFFLFNLMLPPIIIDLSFCWRFIVHASICVTKFLLVHGIWNIPIRAMQKLIKFQDKDATAAWDTYHTAFSTCNDSHGPEMSCHPYHLQNYLITKFASAWHLNHELRPPVGVY